MVLRDRNADANPTTGSGGLEERVYALQDANWNTTAIIAAAGVPGVAAGAVVNRFIYTPFGRSDVLTAAWATAGATTPTPWAHRFQGLEFTDVTNLTHARNRDYSFALGRFIQLDPIGFSAGDNNWYRFVGNGPTAKVDPSGLQDLSVASNIWDSATPAERQRWIVLGMTRRDDDDSCWVDSGVGIGSSRGDSLGTIGLLHGFLVVDGAGYGYFEKDHLPYGTGEWRSDDLHTYPVAGSREDLSRGPSLGTYTSNIRPFYLDTRRYDPIKFKASIKDYIKDGLDRTANKDAGTYSVPLNTCFAQVNKAIYYALDRSKIGTHGITDDDLAGRPRTGLPSQSLNRPKK